MGGHDFRDKEGKPYPEEGIGGLVVEESFVVFPDRLRRRKKAGHKIAERETPRDD